MKTSSTLKALLSIFAIGLLLASCKKNDDIKNYPDAKKFYPATFRNNMVAALGDHPIGYSFTINHKGLLADSANKGFSRMPKDGSIPHSIMRRMNIASITKWLTAMCAVKVLQERGIPLDSPIHPYLPSFWKPSAGAKKVTFHDLLTHTSGLTTGDIRYGTEYQGLKDCIEKPIANPAKGYNYSNVNFGLFRIMMAYMHDKTHALSTEASHMANKDTLNLHRFLTMYYMGRMDENLFKPAGLSGISTNVSDRATVTLSYSATNTDLEGAYAGDWTFKSAGGGYYMSPYELAKLLAYVYHTDKILTTSQRTLMHKNLYGLDGNDSPLTAFGQAYGKGGALNWEDNGQDGAQAGDRGMQCVAMKLPDDVELVLFINSIGDGYASYTNMIRTAYEGAWK